jgi:hypothetical protein
VSPIQERLIRQIHDLEQFAESLGA